MKQLNKILSKTWHLIIIAIMYFLMTIQFLIGWIDRIIIAFLPWVGMKPITKAEYYDGYFFASLVRVLMAAGLFFTGLALYELIY